MKTEIAVPGPLDAAQTLSRFHLWGEDPCNRLVGGSLVRAVEVAERWHGYELRWAGPVDGARLVRRYGTPVKVGPHTVYGFPHAARLARAPVGELRRMQFTTRKAEYVIGLARRVAAGELDFDALARRTNDEVIEALTAVRGFGRWTAEWFLARHLGRGDVCAAGDLGVRRAFEHFYGRGRELSEAAIRKRSLAWGRHQNVAVHYLLAGERLRLKAA